MIKYDYKQFIKEINSGRITEIYFAVKDYAHYSNCYIKKVVRTIPNGKQFTDVEVCLTPDGVERVSFLDTLKEDYKLFSMGRKGTFTLKQMWDKLEINKIVYSE